MAPKKGKKDRAQKPTYKNKMTAFLATAAAVCLLLMAGLALAGTAIAFSVIMPIFVVFSPILVPAGITATVLTIGLMASGGSGATALAILLWLYKKLTGKDPPIKIPAKAKKPADKPAAKPADKPADKPAAKPAKKPADKPADKPAKKPADKPAAKPAAKPEAPSK